MATTAPIMSKTKTPPTLATPSGTAAPPDPSFFVFIFSKVRFSIKFQNFVFVLVVCVGLWYVCEIDGDVCMWFFCIAV